LFNGYLSSKTPNNKPEILEWYFKVTQPGMGKKGKLTSAESTSKSGFIADNISRFTFRTE